MSITEICPNCQRQRDFKDRLEMLNHVRSCNGRFRIQTSEEKAARIRANLLKAKKKVESKREKKRRNHLKLLKAEKQKLVKEIQGLNAKKEKAFYDSWEWLELRFKVLQVYGAKCMCCGNTSSVQVDHIKPRSKFKYLELAIENLQVLCRLCNKGKSNKVEVDFRPPNWRETLLKHGIVTIQDKSLGLS